MKFGGFTPCTLIDYPGHIACMVFTIGCNFRCPYCHNPELVSGTAERIITEANMLEFLKKRQGLLDGVVITGGEPTMHDDLLSFIARVKKLGFLVKLDTNGTNPSMLRKAIEKKLVDYIAMDIKSPLAVYERTVARPVDINAIRQSIDLIMNSPVQYEFRTTVIKTLLSPEDIETIGKEIQGAKRYYLQKFLPTKTLSPQFKRKATYSDKEFEIFRQILGGYVLHCEVR